MVDRHLTLTSALLILCVHAGIIPMVSSSSDNGFFPDINGNLSQITWAHAVNNASYLGNVLKDSDIMMIEADVRMNESDPVMQHSVSDPIDLTLKTFFKSISEYNKKSHNKGVKLDFKTFDAFNGSIALIKQYENEGFPIWINADILKGPVDADTEPVDATTFLSNAAQFLNSTLSIGWTTNHTPNDTGTYNNSHISEMIKVIKDNNVTLPITFPVRAVFAANSIAELAGLIKQQESSTLTIWSGAEDNDVKVDGLRSLISQVGVTKCYIDVPEALLSQLHLDNLPGAASYASFNWLTTGLAVLFAIILNV